MIIFFIVDLIENISFYVSTKYNFKISYLYYQNTIQKQELPNPILKSTKFH